VSSSDGIQKPSNIDISVAEGTLQCVAIDFVVKRKDYDTAIRMFQLNVAAFSMNFDEA
jgi:hypothetical protein